MRRHIWGPLLTKGYLGNCFFIHQYTAACSQLLRPREPMAALPEDAQLKLGEAWPLSTGCWFHKPAKESYWLWRLPLRHQRKALGTMRDTLRIPSGGCSQRGLYVKVWRWSLSYSRDPKMLELWVMWGCLPRRAASLKVKPRGLFQAKQYGWSRAGLMDGAHLMPPCSGCSTWSHRCYCLPCRFQSSFGPVFPWCFPLFSFRMGPSTLCHCLSMQLFLLFYITGT